MMRLVLIALTALGLVTSLTPVHAQVAGSTTVGVEIAELNEVALGWSAKKEIFGHMVYNEKGEKVGKIDDLIIAPDKALSFEIIGAGGFVKLRRHDVAIPVSQFQQREGRAVVEPYGSRERRGRMPACDGFAGIIRTQ